MLPTIGIKPRLIDPPCLCMSKHHHCTLHFNYFSLLLVPNCLRVFEDVITVPETLSFCSFTIGFHSTFRPPLLCYLFRQAFFDYFLTYIVLLFECLSLPEWKLHEGRSFVVFFIIASPGEGQCLAHIRHST